MKRNVLIVMAMLVVALVLVAGTAMVANAAAPANNLALAAGTPTPTTDKAYVGISLADITPQIATKLSLSQTTGVVIVSVAAGSPAAGADIKTGDVVTAVNGAAVKTAKDVTTEVAKAKPGDTVTLALIRGTQAMTVQVKAGTAPAGLNGAMRGFGRILPPDVQSLLNGVPQADLFSHNLGSSYTLKDKNGATVTVSSIPGVVTAISATSITITPNNSQSRGGPFTIDGTTLLATGSRTPSTNDIKVGDQVSVTVVGDSNHASQISKGGMGAGMMGRFGNLPGMLGKGGMMGRNGANGGMFQFRGNGNGGRRQLVNPPAKGTGL